MSGEGLQLFKRRHLNKELKKARECYHKPTNIKAGAPRWRQGGVAAFSMGFGLVDLSLNPGSMLSWLGNLGHVLSPP